MKNKKNVRLLVTGKDINNKDRSEIIEKVMSIR